MARGPTVTKQLKRARGGWRGVDRHAATDLAGCGRAVPSATRQCVIAAATAHLCKSQMRSNCPFLVISGGCHLALGRFHMHS